MVFKDVYVESIIPVTNTNFKIVAPSWEKKYLEGKNGKRGFDYILLIYFLFLKGRVEADTAKC